MTTNFNIPKRFKGQWVALDAFKNDATVVGSGDTLKEAFDEAKAKGYDLPFVIRVPNKGEHWILTKKRILPEMDRRDRLYIQPVRDAIEDHCQEAAKEGCFKV